jgi:hypothetical protein
MTRASLQMPYLTFSDKTLEIVHAGSTGKLDFLLAKKIVGISRRPGALLIFPGDPLLLS